MLSSRNLISIFLLAILPVALAQTFTTCNPLNTTGCPTDPALGTNVTFNWNSSSKVDTKVWNATGGGTLAYNDDQEAAAQFVIQHQLDSPTITSSFYILFGRVSVIMRAATGTGIVSSIVLESDDLDEIDWEFLGGNHTHAETNFFGKGNTTAYDRATWHTLPNNAAPQDDFHNYTIVWNKDKLQWLIDDQEVRTLPYDDKLALGGKNYPQTPMTLKLGIWAGGDPSENEPGVVDWAGGHTDYTLGPFTMYVKSTEVVDFTTGASEYAYGDMTGSWESIKVTNGTAPVVDRIRNPPKSLYEKATSLSHSAKAGIAIGAVAFAGLCVLGLAVCCIVQRRKGRKEKWQADKEFEKNKQELDEFRAEAQALGLGQGQFTGQPREVKKSPLARISHRFSRF
ncbi:MAG: hypothetical protein M1820_000982 [Bogoriella megaspora]|nr:MAG: hypothetical protein M1820_000982 [Bogoriella megaspora]